MDDRAKELLPCDTEASRDLSSLLLSKQFKYINKR